MWLLLGVSYASNDKTELAHGQAEIQDVRSLTQAGRLTGSPVHPRGSR